METILTIILIVLSSGLFAIILLLRDLTNVIAENLNTIMEILRKE